MLFFFFRQHQASTPGNLELPHNYLFQFCLCHKTHIVCKYCCFFFLLKIGCLFGLESWSLIDNSEVYHIC